MQYPSIATERNLDFWATFMAGCMRFEVKGGRIRKSMESTRLSDAARGSYWIPENKTWAESSNSGGLYTGKWDTELTRSCQT